MKTFIIGWKENGVYRCEVVNTLTEARELAKKVSREWQTAQLEGSGIWEHYRDGKFAW
jgi:hypothetical protein